MVTEVEETALQVVEYDGGGVIAMCPVCEECWTVIEEEMVAQFPGIETGADNAALALHQHVAYAQEQATAARRDAEAAEAHAKDLAERHAGCQGCTEAEIKAAERKAYGRA